MQIRPVVLCGGGGARLWPSSTPDRPKSFMRLGDWSLLQATLARCDGLSDGPVVVVGALRHRAILTQELARLNIATRLVLEPASRDTAPAMLAGALRAADRDARAIVALLPSDHAIHDAAAFRAALRQAGELAFEGRLVVLGVRPNGASSAYGHIRPSGPGPSPVAAFIEKPDAATAERLTAEGCLWNSGVLVARVDVLLAEMRRRVPDVVDAVEAALGTDEVLGAAFAEAPRISMDYAVLEATDIASVLPVTFDWSDLGSWDAVATLWPDSSPGAAVVGGEGVWVQAPVGVKVAVVGLSDVLVVIEDGAVLVCSTSAAQQVRVAADRLKD